MLFNKNQKLLIKFAAHLTKKGHKEKAFKIIKKSFFLIKKTNNQNPWLIFRSALQNSTPSILVSKSRIKNQIFYYGNSASLSRRENLGLKWLSSVNKKRQPVSKQLAAEIQASANYKGNANLLKWKLQKIAQLNRIIGLINKE